MTYECLLKDTEWDGWAARGAAALVRRGLKAGDRVAFVAERRWETIAFLFAAWRLSLTAVLLSPRLPCLPEGLDCPLIEPEFADAAYEGRTLSLDQPSLWLFTSGTSGVPKIASFSLRQLFDSADAVVKALAMGENDHCLLSLPLYHVGGLGMLLRALRARASFSFEEKERATIVSLVPTQLYRLLREKQSMPACRAMLVGGAPCPRALFEEGKRAGLPLYLTYGLTEMSSTVLLTENPHWQGEVAFGGFPLPGREMKLHEGEILVRRAGSEWICTGDLGLFDPQYGFAVTGRKDFQFISGGENIQPEEIEMAMLSLAEVEQAVVVPVADEEFGMRPAAFVATSLSASELRERLAALLPKYKIPIGFWPLEKSEKMKPDRRGLCEKIKYLIGNKSQIA